MDPLIEELKRREAASRAEADRLRIRIEELSEDLTRAEEQASRLAIAWEEVTRVLAEPGRRASRRAGLAYRGGDGAAEFAGPAAAGLTAARAAEKSPPSVPE